MLQRSTALVCLCLHQLLVVLAEFGAKEGILQVVEQQPSQRDSCCARIRAACNVDDEFQNCFRAYAHSLAFCEDAVVPVNKTCPFCGAADTGARAGPAKMAGAMAWCERAARKHADKPAAGRSFSEQSDVELALEANALQESLKGETLVISPDCVCYMNDYPVQIAQPCSEASNGPSISKYPAHCLPGWCMVPEHHMGGGRKIQWVSLTNRLVIPHSHPELFYSLFVSET